MHLVIYFCGTGDTGDSFKKGYSDGPINPVRTILVKGCDHEEVCNAVLFPDLKEFAARFTKKFFKPNGKNLNLASTDLANLKIGINKDKSTVSDNDTEDKIEGITLCGYSRGAVTCFEIAKQLKKIAPHIPVNIVVDQPVPGNSYQGPGTNASNIADCRDLTNLRNVCIILGAYTGFMLYKNQEESVLIHRAFFSQIVPKLPHTAHRDLIVIPRESHHQIRNNSPSGEEHLNMQVVKYLHQQGLASKDQVDEMTEIVKQTYYQRDSLPPASYPPGSQLQRFFGIKKEDIYKYTDELHPRANIRKGFEWTQQESLIDWWKKHEKNASLFSSHLTKQLVAVMKNVNPADSDALKDLFVRADKWLILKANSSTSRYHQVEALRNNIYHRLVNEMNIPKSGLAALNHKNLLEENYFFKHWNQASKAASYFKTNDTRILDQAFAKHAREALVNPEADQELINALDKWITAKENSNSKRYGLVVEIREHLQRLMDSVANRAFPAMER